MTEPGNRDAAPPPAPVLDDTVPPPAPVLDDTVPPPAPALEHAAARPPDTGGDAVPPPAPALEHAAARPPDTGTASTARVAAPITSDTPAAHYGRAAPAAPPERNARRRRRLGKVVRWAAAVFAVAFTAAVFAAGVTVGTRLREDPPAPPPDVVIEVDEVQVPDSAPDSASEGAAEVQVPRMANVLGLDVDTASLVIADNTPDATVELVGVPTAGEPGFVVDQDPAPGGADPGVITLSVTAAAEMPDLIGLSTSDARNALEQLGVRVEILEQYVRGTPPGQVLSVEPADGAVPVEVTLIESAPAATAQLSELPSLRSDCGLNDLNVNGEPYTEALQCRVGRATREVPFSVDYDLGRDADQLTFAAGMTDESVLDASARVAVIVDGVEVAAQDVVFGQLVSFDVDTANALRLTITVTGFAEQDLDAYIGIVDARLSGSAAGIDQLLGQS